MIQINKRSIGICILLSIITCGIYGIYWMYLLVKNTRSIQKNTDKCTGEMLCLIFVPFYSLYWWYTRGEKVRQGFAEHDYNATGGGVVYLVLAIFGLSIVSMAIMQSDFNSLKSETHSEQRSTKKASEKEVMWIGRLIVLLVAIVAYFIASSKGTGAQAIMNMVENAWAGFGSAFGPVIILSLFWKRFTYKGAVAGVIGGAAADVLWLLFMSGTGIYEIIPGFIAGGVLAVVVTLLDKKPSAEVCAIYDAATSKED